MSYVIGAIEGPHIAMLSYNYREHFYANSLGVGPQPDWGGGFSDRVGVHNINESVINIVVTSGMCATHTHTAHKQTNICCVVDLISAKQSSICSKTLQMNINDQYLSKCRILYI